MNGSNQSVEIPERDFETKHGEFPPAIAKLLGFTLVSAEERSSYDRIRG